MLRNDERHLKNISTHLNILIKIHVLKEKEQKDSLTRRQTNMLMNDERYLKNF